MKQKLDFSAIEGFDTMSAEDKLKALENFEYDVPTDMSGEVKKYKDLFDSASSQIAELKKQQKANLSEGDRQKAEAEEKFNDLQSKYDELLARTATAEYTTKYIALGYSQELAESTAKATVAGDTDTIIANTEKFRKEIEKKMKLDLLKNTPAPDDKGKANKITTKEDLIKMSPKERYEFSQSHPEEYAKIYGGK